MKTERIAGFGRAGSNSPLYFASGPHTLFGWLHRPPVASAASLGLVICNPFGYETMCAHRSIRAMAESAATVGVPALRFDYAGTGDSSDIDPLIDQIDVWLNDIEVAVRELRRLTGVPRVCLLGIRLGALLAQVVAGRRSEVDALILIAPVVNGARYLRELRTARFAGLAKHKAVPQPAGQPSAADVNPSASEFSGYSMSPATIASLSALSLSSAGASLKPRMLVIDGELLPAAREWTAMQEGGTAAYMTMPGLMQMIFTEPQNAVVPARVLDEVRAWLAAEGGTVKDESKGAVDARMPGPDIVVQMQLPGETPDARSVIERPVQIGSDVALFGVLSEPVGVFSGKAVILLNVGADFHIGANRLYVSLARRWAACGHVVLRLDFGGIGDGITRPGNPDDHVYPPAALDDIRAAIDFLRSHHEVTEMTLAGMCSGAYHAFRAAVARLPVHQILLVNQVDFLARPAVERKERATRKEVHIAEMAGNPRLYRERLVSLSSWQRLLTGKLKFWRLVYVYFRYSFLGVESSFRDVLRAANFHLPRDLGQELESLVQRNVRIAFVFAATEPGSSLLKLLAGKSLAGLGPHCRIYEIAGDHTFTQCRQRKNLEDLLSGELSE